MISPTPITSPGLATKLKLSNASHLKHVGFWRYSKDGGIGYEWRAYERAIRDGNANAESLKQKAELHDTLPWPADHVDESMSDALRNEIAKAMFDIGRVNVVTRYAGVSWDRMRWPHDGRMPWECILWNDDLGSGDVHYGGFVWPEGLFRYVQRYGLILPREFLQALNITL